MELFTTKLPPLMPLADDMRMYAFHLQVNGETERAKRMTLCAIQEDPNNADALGQMATIFINEKKYAEAKPYLDRALELKPKQPGVLYVMSRYFFAQGDYEEAFRWSELANDVDERFTDALIMIAMRHQIIGKRQLQYHYHSLAAHYEPTNPDLVTWKAMDEMLLGHWEVGLANFEARLTRHGGNPVPSNGVRIWTGEDLADKELVIYTEQGAGDCIQFMRFVKTIKQQFNAKKVIVVCHIPHLIELLKYVDGVDAVVNQKSVSVIEHDYQIAMMSVLRHVKRENWGDNWEIFKFPEAVRKLALDGSAYTNVGLCWRGNPSHPNDLQRSVPLDKMLEVIPQDTAYTFHNMQYCPSIDEIHDMQAAGVKKTGLEGEGDILGMALRMLRCKHVVTCDTVVAHLAASLGLAVEMLLPPGPDWRWGYSGDRTIWYPTMKLYRGAKPREWGDVIAAIRKEYQRGA